MQDIKYIDGDKQKGILYDWDKIKKQYSKLKCPKNVYNPLKADFTKFGYVISMSDRSQGKTTNPLLLGMIMNAMYGTIIHYIRCTPDMVTPKTMKDLFKTVMEYGYIEKITKGEWNSCFYYGKRWYYCNVDDDGKIVEKCPEHFMFCCSLAESDNLKSSYNCPRGDLIIFDEFVQLSGYGYNDFIAFTDICKTIIRDRECPVVFMLSNTIDLTSPWFDELCIRDIANIMQQGETRQIETVEGTHIYFEILPANLSEQRQKVNKRFFGFPNPKLAAITGKGTWATENYPHIPPDKEQKARIMYNRLFIRQSGKLLKLQLVKNDTGLCVYVRPATRTYKDSYILTHGEITSRNEIYGFGARGSLLDVFWRLYKANRFYYATNIDGALFKAYVNAVVQMNRNRNTHGI